MHFLPRLAAAHAHYILSFVLAALPLCAQAQTGSPLSAADQQSLLAQQAQQAQQTRRQVTDRILAAGGIPLEGAIDPTSYIVGPGDVFSISTGGAIPAQYSPSVTADGALVIPEIGSFPVAGLSLAEARSRIGVALQRAYRNVETNVALAQPRQFYVHVSGEVARPGRHVAVPVARVEDALAAAMEGNNPLQALDEQKREYQDYDGLPALRNVTVLRQNGDRLVVDLLRYYATGDTQHNPYLQDGDRLYVPTFTRDGEAVFVDRPERATRDRGTVVDTNPARTSVYDYRLGDTVTDLLLVAGGPELLAEVGTVRLLRSNSGGTLDVRVVDVESVLAGNEPDVPLQPRDRLLLPDLAAQAGVAEAEGLVVYPGNYPITIGETTLRDLVAAAGGIRPDGLLRAAYLERRGPAKISERRPTPATAESLEDRFDLAGRDVFNQTRLTDLPFGSRQYLTRELLANQRVSLDLSGDPASIPAVPLRDGDRFVVPRDPGAVLVLGQVLNPGYVPFEPGAGADYYVDKAGGRGPAAAAVYLREAGSGSLRPPENAPIRSGDALFVDRNPMADTEAQQTLALQERQLDFQREAAVANRRVQYLQAGIAVLGTAVGVITTYLFTRNSN